MEQDVVHGKNCSLLSRIGKLESERDKLRQECERLDRQCQEINSTLTAPARIAGKNSAQNHWEEVTIIINNYNNYTVEHLIKDSPRKGQPLYKGHFQYPQKCICNTFSTFQKRTASLQGTK